MMHKNARFDIEDPEMKDGWTGYTAYANSKLMNILFAAELSRRLAGTGVFLASSPEVEGTSGLYFSDGKEAEPSSAARDAALAGRLWDLSARYTRLGI